MAEASSPLPAAHGYPVCTAHQIAKEFGVPYAETLATIRDHLMQLTPDHLSCMYKEIFETGATDCLRQQEEIDSRGSSRPSGSGSKPSSTTSTNHVVLQSETANKSNSCAARSTRDSLPQPIRKTSSTEFSPWDVCKIPHPSTSVGCPIVPAGPLQQMSVTQSRPEPKTDTTRQTSTTDAPRKTSVSDAPRQTSSTVAPRQIPSTVAPRQIPSSVTPRQILSTVVVPRQISSTNAPRQISSSDIPRQTSSTETPIQTSSTDVRRQTPIIIDTYGKTSSTDALPQTPTNSPRHTPSTNSPRNTPSTNTPRHTSSTKTHRLTPTTNIHWQASAAFATVMKSHAFLRGQDEKSESRNKSVEFEHQNAESVDLETMAQIGIVKKSQADEMGTNVKGAYDHIQEYRRSYTYNKLVEYMDTVEPLTQQQSAPVLLGCDSTSRRPPSGARGKALRVPKGRVNNMPGDKGPVEPLTAKKINLVPPQGVPFREGDMRRTRKTQAERNVHSAGRKFEHLTLTVVNFNQFKDGLRPKKC